MANKVLQLLKEKANKSRFIFGRTNIFVKDALPDNISIDDLVEKIENILPERLLRNIDMIYVGQFDVLTDREVNALYAEGAIYITNHQIDVSDMLDDIVHEAAHSLEEELSIDIYGDGELEAEFLGKRARLKSIIANQGYYVVDGYDFLSSDYSEDLDNFFYKEVGYPTMATMTSGLFVSTYACTSLREYFANGFETFYLADRDYLRTISPKLYNKLVNLHNIGEQ
jgi:hypothetical protein